MRPGLHQVVPQVPPEDWVCSPAAKYVVCKARKSPGKVETVRRKEARLHPAAQHGKQPCCRWRHLKTKHKTFVINKLICDTLLSCQPMQVVTDQTGVWPIKGGGRGMGRDTPCCITKQQSGWISNTLTPRIHDSLSTDTCNEKWKVGEGYDCRGTIGSLMGVNSDFPTSALISDRFVNLAPSFLSASKYFKYVWRRQSEHFSISRFISMHLSNNSGRQKGRVEPF